MFGTLMPGHVSSVMAVLAHESCPVTGEIYAAGGGLVAKMFIAETRGFTAGDPTPEDVVENWGKIQDETGYLVPKGLTDYTTISSHGYRVAPPS